MAFATIKISSQDAMNTPNRVVYESETVTAYESLIPLDYDTAQKVFFVTGKDGEEFGQYETEEKAVHIGVQATQLNEMRAFMD